MWGITDKSEMLEACLRKPTTSKYSFHAVDDSTEQDQMHIGGGGCGGEGGDGGGDGGGAASDGSSDGGSGGDKLRRSADEEQLVATAALQKGELLTPNGPDRQPAPTASSLSATKRKVIVCWLSCPNSGRKGTGCRILIMRPLIVGLFLVTAIVSILVLAQQTLKSTGNHEHSREARDLMEAGELMEQLAAAAAAANGDQQRTTNELGNNIQQQQESPSWYDRMMKPVVGLLGYSSNDEAITTQASGGGGDQTPAGMFKRVSQGYLNEWEPTKTTTTSRNDASTTAQLKLAPSLYGRPNNKAQANNTNSNSSSSTGSNGASSGSNGSQLIGSADTNRNGAIVIDKIRGLDLSSGRMGKKEGATSAKQASSSTASYDHRNEIVKCHNSKHDRLIAQKISLNDLSRPVITSDGRFDNPFPTWSKPSMLDIAKFVVTESDESGVPKSKEELDKELPLLKPDFTQQPSAQQQEFRVTWIGHATLLIQVDGLNILTDPVFSDRASPTQLFGPKRYREPACDVKSLPNINAVLISHNHYDHLDANSVKELNDRFGTQCRWIVPLGLGEFLQSMSVENYVELDWWQKDCHHVGNSPLPKKPLTPTGAVATTDSASLTNRLISTRTAGPSPLITTPVNSSDQPATTSENGSPTGGPARATRTSRLELDIYLTPAQHWSRRGLNDVNKSLWGSYTIVNSNGSTFFFAGDTGYCSVFKEIGKVFGPFTGAAIPIGAYKPRWFLKASHVDPNEAVQIHRDLRSMKSIAIHHSTFVLSNEHYKEPSKLLRERMEELQSNGTLTKEPFLSPNHGESVDFSRA